MKAYRIVEGGLHQRFLNSRTKIRIIGGGFGNGKSAAMCIDALQVAKDYPGANMLLARSTYPKLNDTIRKEFFKWCPAEWIKSFSKQDNVCVLSNNTVMNFRYVAQQGKGEESSTSNLLSATYDWIGIDQVEDPEIMEKDILDLLGRLRGSANYIGDDPTRPATGPRQLVLTTNPTANWVYQSLVKPVHEYKKTGKKNDKLLVDAESGDVIIDLFEGSTYENSQNLAPDFIKTLASVYKGQMRDRFLLGKWVAYEGLVYPQFDHDMHIVKDEDMVMYVNELRRKGYHIEWIEGYDHGLAVPACYLLALVGHDGSAFVVDGYYKAESTLDETSQAIREIRARWHVGGLGREIDADPAIFRRTTGNAKTVGSSVATIFEEEYGLLMRRGNNDIQNGILKMHRLLGVQENHRHPLTGLFGAPYLFVSDRCQFVVDEMSSYYWQKDTRGEVTDKPQDRRDHAMDTLRYMFYDLPEPSTLISSFNQKPAYMRWNEFEVSSGSRSTREHRYAN